MTDQKHDLYDPERPSRQDFWEDETKKFCELLKKRGDQRIGQFILNALAEEGITDSEEINSKLWNIEADELLELSKKLEKRI